MRKKMVNIGLLFISILFSLTLLEFLSTYLYDNLPSGFNNGKRIVNIYMGKSENVSPQIEPHPYLLYQNTKNYYSKGFLQHNSYRYRNKEFTLDKKRGGRILALGGSTTHMFPYIENPEDTWVSKLESLLKKSINKNIQIINAGLGYATSAELLSAYVFRHQYLHPDIIIIHTGGNDIAPLLFENYNPEYTHFRAQGNGLIPRKFESDILQQSGMIRLLYAIWLNSLHTVYQSQPYGFSSINREKALDRIKSNKSLGFQRNLDTLIRLAKNDGVKIVLFGFLQARESFISKKRTDLKGLEQALIIGLEKHNKIMRNLSEKYNISFIEPDQALFDDTWFKDNCHLNEKGESMKAKILYRYFMNHKDNFFRINQTDKHNS
jgi:lysophospholipase L1-like esterase